MIEVNLLPPEMRRTEGTPLPRLLTIMAGTVLAVAGALFAASYYFVEMDKLRGQIADAESKKRSFGDVKARLATLNNDLEAYRQKLRTTDTLLESRVRWGRVLNQIAGAVPAEGCVLQRLSYRQEPLARADVSAGPPPKRFTINIQGSTAGRTQKECQELLKVLKEKLMRDLDVDVGQPAAKDAAAKGEAGPAAQLAGYSRFLGLKFEEPVIESRTQVQGGLRKPSDPRLVQLPLPPVALEFTMNISFSLKPPPAAP